MQPSCWASSLRVTRPYDRYSLCSYYRPTPMRILGPLVLRVLGQGKSWLIATNIVPSIPTVNGPSVARQEVESLLEGGVATVTTAVRRCLQFYVNAGAITRSTEESLRALLSSLQEGP